VSWTVADTERSIPERFEEQVRRQSAKQAIDGAVWQPTFGELDAAANRRAHVLLERGTDSAGRVALLLGHDAPLFAATLGVLKAGKTAVALNPSDRPARLEQIRAEVEPELVLTDARHRELALRAGFRRADVVSVEDSRDGPAQGPPGVRIRPDAVAFLIYTSGSTGRPKGVMQTHRNVLHNVLRHTNGLGLRVEDRIAALASLSGGQGVGTSMSALLNGATLCPFAVAERGVTVLARWLGERDVSVLVASASVFRHFVRTLGRQRLRGIRLVRLASEPAVDGDFEAFRRHFSDRCLLANTLASTETGNLTRCLLSSDAAISNGRLPVGRPAEGIEIRLLDDRGQEVPEGETGGIVVRSEYLSPGYWKDEALTRERFISGGCRGNDRLYRTGDLGRLSPDGMLTVVGHRDARVKVRGEWVDLSEIETALSSLPQVTTAAVCATDTPHGDTKLTAYVTTRPGPSVASGGLRRALRSTLSDHAVPSRFVFLDALPLTPQGQMDRGRLAEIEPPPTTAEASASETEALVADIWADALELDQVGHDEDFFMDLGGDSLAAAVAAAGIHASFGVEVDLRGFADNSTVASMAELVDRLQSSLAGSDRPPLSRVSRADPLPLSFRQEAVWRTSLTPEGSLGNTWAVPVRIAGSLDVAALQRSLDHLVRRHEMLRTTFATRDGRPMQLVQPPGPVDVPLIDLTGAADAAEHAARLLAREARIPFDVEQGSLLRLRLVRLKDEEHQLLRVNHHLISDAWSWRVFLKELGVLYEAYSRGAPAPLSDELLLQYGDFAAFERRWLDPAGRRHRKEVAWWGQVLRRHHVPLELPFGRPRWRRVLRRCHALAVRRFARVRPSDDLTESDGVIWWGLRPESSRELDRLGRDAGATYYMTRLAAFAAQLAQETGRDDLVLGTYVTNRRLAELRWMFGDFTNLVALRLSFSSDLSFREWLGRVRATVIQMSAHAQVPHDQLTEALARDGITPPEIRAFFGVSQQPPPWRVAGLEITPLRPIALALPVFSFTVDQWHEADGCQVSFQPGTYDPSRVRSFVARFQRFVDRVCTRPDAPLRQTLGLAGPRSNRSRFHAS
jgi:amino acid adenylation domain-containing protein